MIKKIFILMFVLFTWNYSQAFDSNRNQIEQYQPSKNINPSAPDSGLGFAAQNDTISKNGDTNLIINEKLEHRTDLPFRGIENVASILTGVLKQDNSSLLNIRGGLNRQTKFNVDGMYVNNPFDNSVNIYLPNEVIDNICINTNSIDVNKEYTDQVIVTLPERYDKYYGFAKAITDGFLSTKNKTLGTYSYGYNEYIMAVGGPIIPSENHSFFLSATRRWQQDYKPSWGWSENDNKPDELNKSVIPGNTNSEWSVIAKAKYNITENINVTGNYFRTDRTFSDINPVYLYDSEHAPFWTTNHRSLRLKWNHKIMPGISYQVGFKYLNVFRENYDKFFIDDLWAYGDPNFNPRPVSDENYGILYTERFAPDLLKPGAQYNNYYKNKTTYYGTDFEIDFQLNENHNLKTGFDYKKHTLREFQIYDPVVLATKSNLTLLDRYRLADIRFYGYDLKGNEVDNGTYFDLQRDGALTPIGDFEKQAPYEPIVMNAYLQDEIKYGDFDLNIGLRYDRIDPNAWQFKQPGAQIDNNGAITGMFGGNAMFDKSDIEDSEVHEFISPRIGARFKINHNISLFANYGRYIHSTNWDNLYLSPFFLDSFVNNGGYFTIINNPNIEPGKTINYELGTKMYLSQNILLQASLYYRDIYDLMSFIPLQTDVTELAIPMNLDDYLVKGLDLSLLLQPNINFFIDINFGLTYKNDFGYPSVSNFDIAWQDGGSGNFPKFNVPQREFIKQYAGNISLFYLLKEKQGTSIFGVYPFENVDLNLVARFYSGNPYEKFEITTQLPFAGRYDNDGISERPLTTIKTETIPGVTRFDLKISKKFKLPLNTYLKTSVSVLNLFNTEIIKDVWITTGKPNETGYLNTPAGQTYWAGLTEVEQQNFKLREMDYNNYGIPRQLRLELELGF